MALMETKWRKPLEEGCEDASEGLGGAFEEGALSPVFEGEQVSRLDILLKEQSLLTGNAGIIDKSIYLEGKTNTARVDINAADTSDMVIYHHRLGMHIARIVEINFHPCGQDTVEIREGGFWN